MLRLIVGRLMRGYRASWTPPLRGGLLVAGLLGVGGTVGALTLPAGDLTSDRAPSEVSRLIERLGSDSYATRMRAKEKLQRLGLEAFDELHNAQFHSDYEIAMAASDLVSSLQVSWSKETDPPEVREALDEYGCRTKVSGPAESKCWPTCRAAVDSPHWCVWSGLRPACV